MWEVNEIYAVDASLPASLYLVEMLITIILNRLFVQCPGDYGFLLAID